jgi:Lysylphosphatidylglycerol synthase TM region
VRKPSLATAIASGVLALVLLVALVKLARVDVAQLLRLLAAVKPLPLMELVLLIVLHALLGAEKWRLVERRVAPGAEHSRRLCFCFTAIGTAAAQILPMQLATALARSLGSHLVRGSGAFRGALTSLFEQLFDLIVVASCGAASLYCLWMRDLGRWPLVAGAAVALAFALIGPALAGAAAVASRLTTDCRWSNGRIGRLAGALAESRLFDGWLTRGLVGLSIFRFVAVWLMSVAAVHAAGLNVSGVQLAAALPLVVLATALAVTPGGIGVNEWTFAAALVGFGVDFETATQCALINRVLIAAAALIVGLASIFAAQFAGKRDAARLALSDGRPTGYGRNRANASPAEVRGRVG